MLYRAKDPALRRNQKVAFDVALPRGSSRSTRIGGCVFPAPSVVAGVPPAKSNSFAADTGCLYRRSEENAFRLYALQELANRFASSSASSGCNLVTGAAAALDGAVV